MDIVEAHMPADLPVFRQLMAEYLLEFDAESDPVLTWDDEYYEACRLGLAGGSHAVLLARTETGAVGFAILRLEQMWYRSSLLLGHFEEVYVRPGARRRGVGAGLVRAGEKWLLGHGAATLAATVITENPAALPFWQRLEFSTRAYHLFKS